MAVYHVDVYWPPQLNRIVPSGFVAPSYSYHARQEGSNDRYGKVMLPAVFDMGRARVTEG